MNNNTSDVPSAASATGLKLTWVMTADGLRMRWTVDQPTALPGTVREPQRKAA
jgi:hypothetical protein